jgi:glucan phosphoethanolaminetransferase (alkaline phosphatase superfamily)
MMSEAEKIIKILKSESFSILILVSLLFLPSVINKWVAFLPNSWKYCVPVVITIIWGCVIYLLQKESNLNNNKEVLQEYLLKRKRASFIHLNTEWAGKNMINAKLAKKLIGKYPGVFKFAKVKRGDKYYDGITLTSQSDEIENELSQ